MFLLDFDWLSLSFFLLSVIVLECRISKRIGWLDGCRISERLNVLNAGAPALDAEAVR